MNKKCVCDFKLGNFSCTCGGGKYEIESKKDGESPTPGISFGAVASLTVSGDVAGITHIIPPCLIQLDHEFKSDPQGGAACQVCKTVMLMPMSTVYVYPCPTPRLTGLPVDGYHTWGINKTSPNDYFCSGCRAVWKI